MKSFVWSGRIVHSVWVLAVVTVSNVCPVNAFVVLRPSTQVHAPSYNAAVVAVANFHGRQQHVAVFATRKKPKDTILNTNDRDDAVTKASWYAVETFGKLFGRKKALELNNVSEAPLDLSQPPSSLLETLQRLQNDNANEYFLSGQVDSLIYDPDCVFADPFVSFSGRDRFVENLQNLGSFITKYSAKPLAYDAQRGNSSGTRVTTKFMVKLELNLPWKPVLGWPWGVTCEIDPATNLIVRHEESVRVLQCWTHWDRVRG
jgi:Uncharacterized conserved protein (DUF2358)